MKFDDVPSRYDGPQLETRVLQDWRDADVFHKTLAASEGRPLFTFNEGPPTANGRPGLHHVLARTFKDIYPRYKTMRGFHVPRKAGWDTHGLPVEHEIEKELGIFDKKRIEEEVGIAEFTRRCRESVMRYIGDWEKMTERMGFWVDMKDAYYTLDNSFIESVWYLLKQIFDQGLIYRDYKVVPYDPRIGATLSSHEVAQGYREVEDPSVFVRFRLEGSEDIAFLVWTTTPWTLPSNVALAVHPEVDYVHVEVDYLDHRETLIMAEALVNQVLKPRLQSQFERIRKALPEGDTREPGYRIGKRIKGEELVGTRYQRLFDYLAVEPEVRERICRVVTAQFVSTEDGTGIVHMAPAYGADDLEVGKAQGLPVLHGVGLDGYFKAEVTPVAGKFFKDADPILTRELKERGLMFAAEKMLHNYPFGWRTGDPLIYYAKEAWYIRTTAKRDRLVELNRSINWVPEHIKEGRFGNWLENNIDWALSRERFWGTPLPLWTDGEGNYRCIGSVAELEALCGRNLQELDLHRPAVDEITFVDAASGKTFRRVEEVIDCWFDSGAMSYAQWHYPFENRETFAQHFPADYICEAIDQTRGWFYTLHAIATLVSDSVAYRNVICLSHIVDKDGRKMSKSQGNIINPYDVFDATGADPLRWYFLARIPPDGQKRISVDIVRDVAAGFLNTYWNTYAFFVTYANLDDVDLNREVALAQRPEIDRWVLALLARTVQNTTEALDRFDAKAAGETIESFVDQLSNWYVRRNRRRFWKAEMGEDKQSAYLTLYQCLVTVNKLMAPFMPFITEAVHTNLRRGIDSTAPRSVHMELWPELPLAWRNDALIEETAVVQRVVSLGRAARSESGHRIRQPLSRLLVRVPDEAAASAVQKHTDQVLEELNIKAVEFIARDAGLVSYRFKPNLPRIGKRYGKLIPAIREALNQAAENRGAVIAASLVRGEGFSLDINGETLDFEAADVLVETASAEGYSSAEDEGFLVALDTTLNPDLLREGLARELVRTVQDARKQAGLDIADKIELSIGGSVAVMDALAQWRDYIGNETLVQSWQDAIAGGYSAEHTLGEEHWSIRLSKA